MTTFIDFTPSPIAPFQFQPTLDGNEYTVTVTWNLSAQRWYIDIYALDGTLILSTALVGSPGGVDTDSVTWSRGRVAVTTTDPHGFRVGITINLTLTGVVPDAYNGIVSAFVTGSNTLEFDLSSDPGAATTQGVATYNVSLTSGYFTSTLVYRAANNQFEISP